MTFSEITFNEALGFCVGAVGRWVMDRKIDIPDVDPHLANVTDAFLPVIERVGNPLPQWNSDRRRRPHNERLLGYEVSAGSYQEVVRAVLTNERAFEFVRQRVITNVENGFSRSQDANLIAREFAAGFPKPRRRGAPSKNARDVLVIAMIDHVHSRYGTPKNPSELVDSNDKFHPSGLTLCCAALNAFQVNTTLGAIQKIYEARSSLLSQVAANPQILWKNHSSIGDFASASGFADELQQAKSCFSYPQK